MQKDDAARPNVPEAGVSAPTPRELSAAAKRALAEAEERRRQEPKPAPKAPEIGGRDGLDPVRYGDWETKGIASDF
ncbi:DUF1674 domain-containing protein [Methylovirgula sp. HY1]|uniref:DUF1674 domain-containing protein n=1 Tax=Methylovirgula sp. HY1 TaxID=2822761 RepID=UPI001C5AF54F|nr:DUF1674 domain-containing protein [Methylovirgula sp. HY1]QXX75762.1 hypothetical protein MHY1_02593 [Methylovirgula sp. HY1]